MKHVSNAERLWPLWLGQPGPSGVEPAQLPQEGKCGGHRDVPPGPLQGGTCGPIVSRKPPRPKGTSWGSQHPMIGYIIHRGTTLTGSTCFSVSHRVCPGLPGQLCSSSPPLSQSHFLPLLSLMAVLVNISHAKLHFGFCLQRI